MADTPASRQGRVAARLVSATRPRRVWVLAFPGVQVLDVTGPWEVFALANRIGSPRTPRYELTLVAPTAGPAGDLGRAGADGGAQPRRCDRDRSTRWSSRAVSGTRPRERDPRLVAWIRRTARRTRRVASVCTGAFLLAEAGLLDGRRADHPLGDVCDALQRRFPAVRVERDPIFVRDGTVVTSAGVTAGHGPGAGAGRGGLRARAGAHRRALARHVPASAGWPVAVQRAAGGPAGRARRRARGPGLDRRAP